MHVDLAGQDEQFAGYVVAAKVLARIGFGKALVHRLAQDLVERAVFFRKMVENIAQRPGEHAPYPQDLVTRVVQLADGIHQRKSCADIGLVEERLAFLAQEDAQGTVKVVRDGVGHLVRGYDVASGRHETRIQLHEGG